GRQRAPPGRRAGEDASRGTLLWVRTWNRESSAVQRKGLIREGCAGQLLEVADQPLAPSPQVAVLDAAARESALDALDERTVLDPDLVVEGQKLVDPCLVDGRAEEVV